MDLVMTVISFLAGWLISHLYSRSSSKELQQRFEKQEGVISKLPEAVVAALAAEHRQKLTVKELNSLIRQLTLDDAGAIKACQQCGSGDLATSSGAAVDYDRDGSATLSYYYDTVECRHCGWKRNEYSKAGSRSDERDIKEGEE